MKPAPGLGSLVKFEWAHDELNALHNEIAYWIKADPYESTSDFYPEANIVALRIHMPGGEPPLSWGVRAGNVIHSLRSALDYLITDLVLLNDETPSVGPGGNQFPILPDPPVSRKGNPVTFADKTASSLQGVRGDHRAMIESLQPYYDEQQMVRCNTTITILLMG
jgi:hypothetical protein